MGSTKQQPLSASTAGSQQTAGPGRARLEAVDRLRGVVMILMALDHVRGYFANPFLDPTDLARTNVPLFLTRWVSHLCAPTFIFLAGTGAYLAASRGKPRSQLTRAVGWSVWPGAWWARRWAASLRSSS